MSFSRNVVNQKSYHHGADTAAEALAASDAAGGAGGGPKHMETRDGGLMSPGGAFLSRTAARGATSLCACWPEPVPLN